MRPSRVCRLVLAGLALAAAPAASAEGRAGRTADPAAVAAEAAAVPPSGWVLLWGDEFDLPGAPDSRYWSHEVNCAGGGNNEKQCYTDRLDNAFVDDHGVLHIVAREEFFTGPSLQDEHPDYPGPPASRSYTSARLRTRDKADWRYGRIEVRARLPGGQGMWPAIWMLPTDWHYGGWPSSGEIDIVEAVNLPADGFAGWGSVVHGTLHYGLRHPQWENHGWSYPMAVNPADDFHVYALEWEADQIRWYVDDVHYQTQTSAGWYNYVWAGQERGFEVANDRAPFDKRFHLLLNVAVGGDWPGTPDTGWAGDREMLVDYVRVYRCGDPGAGPAHRSTPRSRGQAPRGNRSAACRAVNRDLPVHQDFGAPGTQEAVVYDGRPGTLSWEVWLGGAPTTVANTLVRGAHASDGVTVDSELLADGTWGIEFDHAGAFPAADFVGSVSLGTADMAGVDGVEPGFNLYGGTGWAKNGELELEMKVETVDPDTRLFVRLDSDDAAVGRVEIAIPTGDRWHHVAVRLEDLLDSRQPGAPPLDLSNIRNVFVLESTGPARIRVDGIYLQCAFNREPEPWQVDKVCGIAPRL